MGAFQIVTVFFQRREQETADLPAGRQGLR